MIYYVAKQMWCEMILDCIVILLLKIFALLTFYHFMSVNVLCVVLWLSFHKIWSDCNDMYSFAVVCSVSR